MQRLNTTNLDSKRSHKEINQSRVTTIPWPTRTSSAGWGNHQHCYKDQSQHNRGSYQSPHAEATPAHTQSSFCPPGLQRAQRGRSHKQGPDPALPSAGPILVPPTWQWGLLSTFPSSPGQTAPYRSSWSPPGNGSRPQSTRPHSPQPSCRCPHPPIRPLYTLLAPPQPIRGVGSNAPSSR